MNKQPYTLMELFEAHQGRVVHKFPHHIEVYDRLFWPFNDGRDITMLEIGIADGGSLELWRKYFGRKATIIGVDIQDRTDVAVDSGAKVYVGDQGERSFWDLIRPQLGEPDIIIDDGSHQCAHQILTFNELFPILKDGGLYIVEDIHTSYREGYGGGIKNHHSFVNYLKLIVDEIHYSEHLTLSRPASHEHVFGISIYPNLAVIHKRDPKHWGGSTMRPVEPHAH